jgi:hypothetical protein
MAGGRLLGDGIHKREGVVPASLVRAIMHERPGLICIYECRPQRIPLTVLRYQNLKKYDVFLTTDTISSHNSCKYKTQKRFKRSK